MAKNISLKIANKKLVFQNHENDKLAAELIIANEELKKTVDYQKKCIQELEEMMFITHKLHQPIAQILGLSILLTNCGNSQADINKMISMIQKSAQSLDNFTRDLTTFIHRMKLK